MQVADECALVVAVATLLAAGSVASWVFRRAASELRTQTEEKLTALMQRSGAPNWIAEPCSTGACAR